jgi:hypothetical protein
MTWGSQISKLIKLLKKALRIIALAKYNAHSEPILKKLNLLNLSDIVCAAETKILL